MTRDGRSQYPGSLERSGCFRAVFNRYCNYIDWLYDSASQNRCQALGAVHTFNVVEAVTFKMKASVPNKLIQVFVIELASIQ